MALAHYYVLSVGLCSLLLCDSILAVSSSSSADDDTKCLYTSCNPYLLDGDPSYWLGCIYPEDLNETKSDFSVHRYPLPRTNRSTGPDRIVECNWLDKAKLTCKIKPGYNISGPVSDTLTINVPDPMPEHEGDYVCIVVGGKYGPIPCRLTLTALPGIPMSVQIVDRTKSTLTVQWTRGSSGKLNLTQYFRIRYRKQNKTEIPRLFYKYHDIPFPDATNFTIQGLEPSSIYEVSVLAFNGVGESKFHTPDLTNQTLKPGDNEDAQNSTVESTGGLGTGTVVAIAVLVLLFGLVLGAVLGILVYRFMRHHSTAQPRVHFSQVPQQG